MNGEYNRERLEKALHELCEIVEGHEVPEIIQRIKRRMNEPVPAENALTADIIDTVILEIFLNEIGFDWKGVGTLHHPRVEVFSYFNKQPADAADVKLVRAKTLKAFEAWRIIPKKKKKRA